MKVQFSIALMIFLPSCASVSTYGPEFEQLTSEQKWFVSPWDKHGDIPFSKPFVAVVFEDEWKLRQYCGFSSWFREKGRSMASPAYQVASRKVGCYMDERQGKEIPEIVYIKGMSNVRLHELAHHYELISDRQ